MTDRKKPYKVHHFSNYVDEILICCPSCMKALKKKWKKCPKCKHEIDWTKDSERDAQRDYEQSVEYAQYCERYEPTYNPEDGSM